MTTVVAASEGMFVKVPVMVTSPADSAAFKVLSSVTESTVKPTLSVFGGVVSPLLLLLLSLPPPLAAAIIPPATKGIAHNHGLIDASLYKSGSIDWIG